jgi:hypothetical protein
MSGVPFTSDITGLAIGDGANVEPIRSNIHDCCGTTWWVTAYRVWAIDPS